MCHVCLACSVFLVAACSQKTVKPTSRGVSQAHSGTSDQTDSDQEQIPGELPPSLPPPVPEQLPSDPLPVVTPPVTTSTTAAKKTALEPTTPPNPPVPLAKPIMLVTGNDGRSMLSCDDGKTWRHKLQAYATGDQFHSPTAHTSTVYANGKFYSTFGWATGLPFVTLRASDDGVNWTDRTDVGTGYVGIASAGNSMALFASYGAPRYSTNAGESWTSVNFRNGDHIRMFKGMGGNYVGIGGVRSDGTANIVTSTDGGVTYVKHQGFNGKCTKSPSSLIMTSATSWFIMNQAGHACLTRDNGVSFTESQVLGVEDTAMRSNTIWTGDHFYVVGNSDLFKSADGVSWQKTAHPFVTGWGVSMGHNPLTGTLIVMARIGGSEYMTYRSENKGATWTLVERNIPTLPYFKSIDFGYTKNPAVCD